MAGWYDVGPDCGRWLVPVVGAGKNMRYVGTSVVDTISPTSLPPTFFLRSLSAVCYYSGGYCCHGVWSYCAKLLPHIVTVYGCILMNVEPLAQVQIRSIILRPVYNYGAIISCYCFFGTQ